MDNRVWPIPHVAFSKQKTIVFIDFETTGFTPCSSARIIEYSAIKVTPTETTVFHEMAKPYMYSMKSPMTVPSRIEELTKITNEMLVDADSTFNVFRRFHEFVNGHICIAHNAKFEHLFYEWYCKFTKLENNCVFRDTQPMFRKHYNLAALSKITESENAHMAFDDCVSMIRLMKECQEADPELLKLMKQVDLKDSQKVAILESLSPKGY